MRVAITGGIGSGKTFVCRLLEHRKVEIYDCDREAKRLIKERKDLQERLKEVVGAELFQDGKMDKACLSRFILASKANALAIDNIVHPAVAQDFISSMKTWVESALLFESDFNERIGVDFVACVTAPLETRIRRIMGRDSLSREKALQWINCQMSQEEMLRRSDFEIKNDEGDNLEGQIDDLLRVVNNYRY